MNLQNSTKNLWTILLNKLMKNINLQIELHKILSQYRESFSEKTYSDENNDSDVLMNLFGITPELKRENRQYWGRELGMCWQLLINKLCEIRVANTYQVLY